VARTQVALAKFAWLVTRPNWAS